jgi:IS5 family transposase
MAHRRVGEAGFVDGMVSHRGKRDGETLQRVSALINWAAIDQKIGPLYPSRTGELAYPPLVMFKILLLQAWYGLSDPEMENAMDDRLSFGRFAGLSLEDEVPDHSTIWRFRERLAKSGLDQALFEDVARQLEGAGFVVKKGTLIDASLVSSAARRPRMSEGKTSPADPEARFGTSNERGRFEFGYKMHVRLMRVQQWCVMPFSHPAMFRRSTWPKSLCAAMRPGSMLIVVMTASTCMSTLKVAGSRIP